MQLFLQVPEWNFYKRNNLSLKFYAETVTYANLIFGIVVLFVVIMKEDSVLRAHQNFYLQEFFFRLSLFTSPLIQI